MLHSVDIIGARLREAKLIGVSIVAKVIVAFTAIVAVIVSVGWWVKESSEEFSSDLFHHAMEFHQAMEKVKQETHANWPPGFQKAMEVIELETHANFNGELGQRARKVCRGRLDLPETVNNAEDAARRYGANKAIAFMQCVVEEMYPETTRRFNEGR